MDQNDYKIIRVFLFERDKENILEFDLFGNKHEVNLNNDEKNKLDELFYTIVENLKNNLLEFVLDYNKETYKNGLFIEIATEYINALNSEISTIYSELKTDLERLEET